MFSVSTNTRFTLGLALLSLLVGSCGGNNQPVENTDKKEEVKKDTIPSKVEKDTVIIESTDATFIKSNFKFKGTIQEFVKWKDGEGTHIVFTTVTKVTERENTELEEFTRYKDLFCYHYLQKDETFESTWTITDNVSDCPVDITLDFVKKSLHVTDLDKNGIGEVWTMYRSACRGDVSPTTLKLIMYQGDTKYKLEGNSLIVYPEGETDGGDIYSIKGFVKGDAFIDYAKTFWKKYMKD
jgi:hypothetical protein